MDSIKLAAIDIGSNAIRLLLSKVISNGSSPQSKKECLVRIPIRLGDDVFSSGEISPAKIDGLIKTMKGYQYLMDAYNARDYMACATSAMREAQNGPEVVKKILDKTGIDIEIIDGRREAEIICSHRPKQIIEDKKVYLFVDVGGGSTELTVFSQGQTIDTNSFNIGGIRVLKDKVPESSWKELRKWLKSNVRPLKPAASIGSGGNINKIFRLSRIKEGEAISYKKIKHLYRYLKSFTFEERVKVLRMRTDRADVIIPASEIYLSVMKWAGIKEMYVPMAGLSDGLVHILYNKYNDS